MCTCECLNVCECVCTCECLSVCMCVCVCESVCTRACVKDHLTLHYIMLRNVRDCFLLYL